MNGNQDRPVLWDPFSQPFHSRRGMTKRETFSKGVRIRVGRKQKQPWKPGEEPPGDCYVCPVTDVHCVWIKASIWLCQIKYNPRAISASVPHSWLFWIFSNICLWLLSPLPPCAQIYSHPSHYQISPSLYSIPGFKLLLSFKNYLSLFWFLNYTYILLLITSCWVIEVWLPRVAYVSYYLWRFPERTEDTFLRSVKRGSLIWQIFAERWLCPGCSSGSWRAGCSK